MSSTTSIPVAVLAAPASGNEVEERKPLPYLFEKELIEKQNRHCHIFEEFIPVGKVLPIEAKFHARHEQQSLNSEIYYKHLENTQSKRRAKHGFPCLESQVYGWLPESVKNSDLMELNFISAPKLRCNMTIFDEKRVSERVTERPAFNGLRFFL